MIGLPPGVARARTRATFEAGMELRAAGFTATDDGLPARDFEGPIETIHRRRLRLRVRLPIGFPIELPEVFADGLHREAPHIERSGKVCLTADVGLFLDASRPRDIVRDALARARDILGVGLRGENTSDFIDEYNAYWEGRKVVAVAHAMSATNATESLSVTPGPVPGYPSLRVAGRLTHREPGSSEWAVVAPLTRSLDIPRSDTWSLADVGAVLATHAPTHVRRRVATAIRNGATLLVLLMPVSGGRLLPLAVSLPRCRSHRARAGLSLLARSPSDAGRWTRKLRRVAVERWTVLDLDRATLLPRAGGVPMLDAISVTLVGCGSVGGFLAAHLARLGVRRLCLVDDDELSADNIFRHVLGARYVGRPKVDALREKLLEDHPDLDVVSLKVRGDVALAHPRVRQSDALLLSTGDHAVEIELADAWSGRLGAVHVWVEPLGLGGHVLHRAKGARGCLACLFTCDEKLGPVNGAAFAAPGQRFSRTQAGCAGSFTPFSVLDADRSAAEAARMLVAATAGETCDSMLVSWRGSSGAFLAAGFGLSARGHCTQPGTTDVSQSARYLRSDCPSCGRSACRAA